MTKQSNSAAVFLAFAITGCCYNLVVSGFSSPAVAAKTTIAVCTGPDCRVDGASDCMRQLQQSVKALNTTPSMIRVTGRNCMGPCGDGPCVMVLDGKTDQKIVVDQPSKRSISLAPPDLFASNPKGWYQVRTKPQLKEVMDIACQSAAGLTFEDNRRRDASSSRSSIGKDDDLLIVNPTRQFYDRPRNERKVLQRLMQVIVLAGYYGLENDEPTQLQYGIGVGLFVLSNFIMKDNLLEQLWKKLRK